VNGVGSSYELSGENLCLRVNTRTCGVLASFCTVGCEGVLWRSLTLKEERMTAAMSAVASDRPIAVSVSRAATLVGVSRATIRAFAKSGRLQIARLGRRVIVPMNSLEQLVRESTQP
jgi:excisionase family DNA binding protein